MLVNLLGQIVLYFVLSFVSNLLFVQADDVVGCGGFVQSEVDINYSLVQVSCIKVAKVRLVALFSREYLTQTFALSFYYT